MFELLDGWALVRFLHVLGAVFWVGGQMLLSLAVVPVLRTAGDEMRSTLGGAVGRRFAVAAFGIGLPVQVATGIALAAHRGVTYDSFSRAGYGATLGAKIVLVAVAVGLAVGHGIAAARGNDGLSRAMGLGSLVAAVLVVFFATALVP